MYEGTCSFGSPNKLAQMTNTNIFAAKLFELVQFTEYTFQLMNVELAFKIQTVKSVP